MQKPRIFKSSPWNLYFVRNVYAKQKNKLWHYLRSSIALKRLGNPPIPTGGPTNRTSGPSHSDKGTKTVETDELMSLLSTLWSFGDSADNAQNVNAILSPRLSLRHPWKFQFRFQDKKLRKFWVMLKPGCQCLIKHSMANCVVHPLLALALSPIQKGRIQMSLISVPLLCWWENSTIKESWGQASCNWPKKV